MIGILAIATGPYKRFLPLLVAGIEAHTPMSTTLNLFTDDVSVVDWDLPTVALEIPHEGFPGATLHRYNYFAQHESEIIGDHLVYLDADMEIVQDIGTEFQIDGIFAVEHNGFKPGEGTWESNPLSTAYTTRQSVYCAGGVQGGERDAYLEVCRLLAANIRIDDHNGITAIWHDESHWNCYISEHPVIRLPSTYCWPDEQTNENAKIRCLNKGLVWTSRIYPT